MSRRVVFEERLQCVVGRFMAIHKKHRSESMTVPLLCINLDNPDYA